LVRGVILKEWNNQQKRWYSEYGDEVENNENQLIQVLFSNKPSHQMAAVCIRGLKQPVRCAWTCIREMGVTTGIRRERGKSSRPFMTHIE
jgi:hypothetical protein